MSKQYLPDIPLNSHHKQKGFTLVELMVVIVIIGVLLGTVAVSMGVGEQRRKMQIHSQLVDDLAQARMLALQKQQLLGVRFAQNEDEETFYEFVTLDQASWQALVKQVQGFAKNAANTKYGNFDGLSVDLSQSITGLDVANKKVWQPLRLADKKKLKRTLNYELYVQTSALDDAANNSYQINDSLFGQYTAKDSAPSLLWFGNGEAAPMRVQLMHADRQIGQDILINAVGAVELEQ